jgi:hypothetical protein
LPGALRALASRARPADALRVGAGATPETDAEKEAAKLPQTLRPLLKLRLSEARQAILAMPQMPEKKWRELQIRKPNGDTQRLRTIFGNN